MTTLQATLQATNDTHDGAARARHGDPSGRTTGGGSLATVALALGIAGLLPVLPVLGSLAAVACGTLAVRTGTVGDRGRAAAGLVLGIVGLLGPLMFLLVYCGILGYPFPIEPYRPNQ
jgi:hypothetical protein